MQIDNLALMTAVGIGVMLQPTTAAIASEDEPVVQVERQAERQAEMHEADIDDDELTVADLLEADEALGVFTAAIATTGQLRTLQRQDEEYTVFAPTNAAFAALERESPGILELLFSRGNTAVLSQILGYHMVAKGLPVDKLKTDDLRTLEGSRLQLIVGESIEVDDAIVTQPGVPATNGVLYVIDKIILPPAFSLVPKAD
jgi:uncharacterized surface protein with fasciclin (FAS1) repeats